MSLAENYFALSKNDQKEALETAAGTTGLPPYLLEKDIWVVWALSALFQSKIASSLTFKGGTSLSKAYKIIRRFSEDIDLTCDMRIFIPEASESPVTSSQAKKWSDKIRKSLPVWIKEQIIPIIESAFKKDGISARLEFDGNDKLLIHYPPLTKGVDYVSQTIQLEFGARSTGEPNEKLPVTCDIADQIKGVAFPSTIPNVMRIERTFWEKATAIHVYCHQKEFPSDRFSRHWYDLVEISNTVYFASALRNRGLAQNVARHKDMFFKEKDSHKKVIDYAKAVSGKINLVPIDKAFYDLSLDYKKMTEAGLILNPPDFENIMKSCRQIETKINIDNQ